VPLVTKFRAAGKATLLSKPSMLTQGGIAKNDTNMQTQPRRVTPAKQRTPHFNLHHDEIIFHKILLWYLFFMDRNRFSCHGVEDQSPIELHINVQI